MDESLNFNNMLPTKRPLRDNTNYQQRRIGRYSNVRMMHTSTSKIVNCQKSKEATQSQTSVNIITKGALEKRKKLLAIWVKKGTFLTAKYFSKLLILMKNEDVFFEFAYESPDGSHIYIYTHKV